jgi:nucleoside-diphosphate-sugar epimerase
MKKILVTGATGFIGQYVVSELLLRGHRVIASSAHADKAANAPWYDKVDYIPFDLSQADPSADYYHFFGQPDNLIHLAWEGLPDYKAGFHLQVNYPRHAAFLENLIRGGLRDITVTGTCFEYGMQEGSLREDLPPQPDNQYALAKDTLRRFLEDLQARQHFVLKWARLFYMYGKGQNQKSLLSQLDRAIDNGDKVFNMSGGEQVRDYLPVEKAAEYIVRIALQQKVTGIINCCSAQPVTIKELVEQHLRRRDAEISLNTGYYPYPDYEPMRFWGNDAKLKTILKDE